MTHLPTKHNKHLNRDPMLTLSSQFCARLTQHATTQSCTGALHKKVFSCASAKQGYESLQ